MADCKKPELKLEQKLVNMMNSYANEYIHILMAHPSAKRRLAMTDEIAMIAAIGFSTTGKPEDYLNIYKERKKELQTQYNL